jgi:hypothetical protein
MLSQTFDVSRITNLENRLTQDEAMMITNNDTARQVIPYINFNGTLNAMVSILDPATNGIWWGIMQDPNTYNMAIGRFVTGSKAIELRSYFDNLTLRTGRSSAATSADLNIITNDQVVAGISADINLMPRGSIHLSPNNGGTKTNGLECLLTVTGGFPAFRSINTAVSNYMLKFASNGVHSRDSQDTVFAPFYGSAFNVSSAGEFKDNIVDYQDSALEQIKKTKVRKYKLKEDDPTTPDRIGLIREEAPAQLHAEDDTLDLYQMVSLLWKSVQELSAQVTLLQGSINNGK